MLLCSECQNGKKSGESHMPGILGVISTVKCLWLIRSYGHQEISQWIESCIVGDLGFCTRLCACQVGRACGKHATRAAVINRVYTSGAISTARQRLVWIGKTGAGGAAGGGGSLSELKDLYRSFQHPLEKKEKKRKARR